MSIAGITNRGRNWTDTIDPTCLHVVVHKIRTLLHTRFQRRISQYAMNEEEKTSNRHNPRNAANDNDDDDDQLQRPVHDQGDRDLT